ncbi:MAG: nucleotidyltransferase domain-containing protein [Legionellaceae bacterium]|nr:nucleotidyltransferase domain-containing protein [Legionellaceae bacterium]
MNRTDLINKQFYTQLTTLPFVEKIILYGSRARGDCQPRSDIDLAIDCPYASIHDWQKILNIVDEADTLLAIDCVQYDTLALNNPLKQAIDRDGIMLYEKNVTS